jgi:DNA protecting protein DprA
MSKEEIFLLAFHLVDGIGPVKIRKIFEEFGSFEEAYKNRNKISPKVPELKVVEDYLKNLKRFEVEILTFLNPKFPKVLNEFENLPKVIYYKGNLEVLENSRVSIVGTRYPSPSAKNFVYKLSNALYENGFTVVSGGAIGIDSAAHRGAMGRTVVVIGCGLSRLYPKENRPLFEEILEKGGLIVSEFPLYVPPNRGNFPARNRVIAALGDVVVIGQSPAKSGALITARWALDYGKDIWAIPGDPDDMRNHGSNKLLYDGAKPLYDIAEFLKDIRGENFVYSLDKPKLNEKESALIEFLREGRNLDEIVENFGKDVFATLFNLQVKGYVLELPGKVFKSNI